MINRNGFIDALIRWFPEIKEQVLDEDYNFSLGLQLGCFKRFTQAAIDGRDIEKIKKCSNFLDSVIDNLTNDVENSLYVSYLSHLDFSKDEKLKKNFSKKIRKLLDALTIYGKEQSTPIVDRFLRELE